MTDRRSPPPTWRRAGRRSCIRREGVSSARESYFVMVDKVEAPDPTTVVFRLKFATGAFLPALADPYRLDLQEGDPRQGSALVREEHHGLRPVQVRRLRDRPVDQGRAQPRLLSQGTALSRRLHRHLRRQAGGARRRHPRRPRGDGVPRPAALGARPAREGARRQDHGADQRLELRQPDHAEPQEEAVRRRAGAPRAGAGDRPVARRAGALEDRQRPHRRRHRLPGLAAGGDQGGAREDRRATGPTSRSRAPRPSAC